MGLPTVGTKKTIPGDTPTVALLKVSSGMVLGYPKLTFKLTRASISYQYVLERKGRGGREEEGGEEWEGKKEKGGERGGSVEVGRYGLQMSEI